MRSLPPFGVQLKRLAEIRGLDADVLASRARAAEREITLVLDGGEPDPSLLRRLAPALGLHRSDVFVIAGQDVPDDLGPLDPTAANGIGHLAWSLAYLPRAVPQLLRLVQSLPQLTRLQRSAAVPAYLTYPSNAGGLVVRLLHNRNLHWSGTARHLFCVGRGPMLSASTIGVIGQGQKALTPELLTRFAALLDISSLDLSALTGIEPGDVDPPVHPDAAEAAELIWNARRLSAEQVRHVGDVAHVIRHERAEELRRELRCRCPGPG